MIALEDILDLHKKVLLLIILLLTEIKEPELFL